MSLERVSPFGKFKSFIRGQFLALVFLWSLIVGFQQSLNILTMTSWRHTEAAGWISSEGFWSKDLTWSLHYPWLQGAFLYLCSVSLYPKKGEAEILNLYPDGLLSVLAMIISLRCLQETKTGHLPWFCCYSILRTHGRPFTNSSTGPIFISCFRKCKRRLML